MSYLVAPKQHDSFSSRSGWIDYRWADSHVFRLVSTISKSTNINILILFELRWKTGHRSWECCQDDMRMYCLYKIACVMTGHGVSVEEEALSMRCDGSEGGSKDVCHDRSPGRKEGRSFRSAGRIVGIGGMNHSLQRWIYWWWAEQHIQKRLWCNRCLVYRERNSVGFYTHENMNGEPD